MGQIIDHRYTIIKKIGEGGMGAVYLAEDTRLRRKVAIKRLQLTGKLADIELFQQRFEREALEMASFQHPHIVSVHDFGYDEEGVYLVQEYMPGGTLTDHMGEGALPVEEAVTLLLPLADALQAIHDRGRVHRDVKPANILFDAYGHLKLADFGVVKLLEGQEGLTLTATGAAVGTPAYMAPELIAGEASAATDQYALGVVLYEMVTGKKPYHGRTPMETLYMHKTAELPDPRTYNPGLTGWVCEVLKKVLAKEPPDRYVDMMAFAQALRAGAFSQEESVGVDTTQVVTATERGQDGLLGGTSTDLLHIPPTQPPTNNLVGESLHPEPPSVADIVREQPGEAPLVEDSRKLPRWLLWAGAGVVLVGVMIVIGIMLANLATRASDALAVRSTALNGDALISTATATESVMATRTSTATITPTITSTPTVTVTSTITMTPTLEDSSFTRNEKDNAGMVYVPEGEFMMGSDHNDDPYFWGAEGPPHLVFTDAFWIYEYEVTNQMYAECVADNECLMPQQTYSVNATDYYESSQYQDHPVIFVTYLNASSYCAWAGGRLPYEAEWEKAARGTSMNLFPWGNDLERNDLANLCGSECARGELRAENLNDGYAGPAPIGSFPNGVSPYGAYDMAGNVWEWVYDWFQPTFFSSSPYMNPVGPSSGSSRVIRGGSWTNYIDGVRAVARSGINPSHSFDTLGFRCVVDIAE
jgi:eukaryotic-like serine/threonine-protein kinase